MGSGVSRDRVVSSSTRVTSVSWETLQVMPDRQRVTVRGIHSWSNSQNVRFWFRGGRRILRNSSGAQSKDGS